MHQTTQLCCCSQTCSQQVNSLTGEASSKCFVMAIWCFELKYWLQSIAIHYNYCPNSLSKLYTLCHMWVKWSASEHKYNDIISDHLSVWHPTEKMFYLLNEFHPEVPSMSLIGCPVASMSLVNDVSSIYEQYIFMILSVCLIYESRLCIHSANHINMVEVNGLTTSKLPGSFLHKGKRKYLGNHSNMCMIIC